jgi:hypothetical protein
MAASNEAKMDRRCAAHWFKSLSPAEKAGGSTGGKGGIGGEGSGKSGGRVAASERSGKGIGWPVGRCKKSGAEAASSNGFSLRLSIVLTKRMVILIALERAVIYRF